MEYSLNLLRHPTAPIGIIDLYPRLNVKDKHIRRLFGRVDEEKASQQNGEENKRDASPTGFRMIILPEEFSG